MNIDALNRSKWTSRTFLITIIALIQICIIFFVMLFLGMLTADICIKFVYALVGIAGQYSFGHNISKIGKRGGGN